jgi:hypothetical protein
MLNIARSYRSFERTIWEPWKGTGFAHSGWRYHERGIAQFRYDHYCTMDGRKNFRKWWLKIWIINGGVQYSEYLELTCKMNRQNVIRAVCSWIENLECNAEPKWKVK